MSQTTQPTRRKALQFLASAPLLPLGSTATAALLATGCGGGDGSTLATTGASPSGWLLLGGILVAAGGLILVMARRRTYRGLHE